MREKLGKKKGKERKGHQEHTDALFLTQPIPLKTIKKDIINPE